MVGIAREVAALTGARMRMPDLAVTESGGNIEDLVTVKIEDTAGCPRYTARVVSDVTIGPSPPWMQRRLVAAGLRPINNVVDITNYVLVELGQPLHAFDLELLGERTIVVRRANPAEPITTLDGVDRELDDQSLVIADISRPVALAGVIGGEDSEVRDETRNILIESAYQAAGREDRSFRQVREGLRSRRYAKRRRSGGASDGVTSRRECCGGRFRCIPAENPTDFHRPSDKQGKQSPGH
jgi:phenylalanyl-tRNA synthetase beta chain